MKLALVNSLTASFLGLLQGTQGSGQGQDELELVFSHRAQCQRGNKYCFKL